MSSLWLLDAHTKQCEVHGFDEGSPWTSETPGLLQLYFLTLLIHSYLKCQHHGKKLFRFNSPHFKKCKWTRCLVINWNVYTLFYTDFILLHIQSFLGFCGKTDIKTFEDSKIHGCSNLWYQMVEYLHVVLVFGLYLCLFIDTLCLGWFSWHSV
jgi:hypothetical protein